MAQGLRNWKSGGGFLRDTAQVAMLTILPVFNGVSTSGCLQCNLKCQFLLHTQADDSDGSLAWCSMAVLSEDCGAYGHGMLVGGPSKAHRPFS